MNKRPFPVAGYSVEELDGEILLFNITSDKILHCNPTAALVWKLCDGQQSVAEIIALLQSAYPETAVSIATDVPHILNTFVDAGAIEWQ